MWLKAELFQKTGSFKVRGVLNKLATLSPEERARGVIGISAGNHAQALAWGAAAEGIDCLVVMWASASETKIDATRAYGASVDLDAADPTAAFDRLNALVAETGRILVHPFDDPVVLAGRGHGRARAPGGRARGGDDRRARGRRRARVRNRGRCARPARRGGRAGGSAAVHEGLAAGKSVWLVPDSIADGLSAPYAGETALGRAAGERRRERARDGGGDRGRASASSTRAPSSRASPRPRSESARCSPGKLRRRRPIAFVVSGGNVLAQTASAILGRP